MPSYIIFNKSIKLNEADATGMTAAELVKAGITSVKGFGGIDIPVNKSGYLVNPASQLPSGMLDNLKNAWSSSGGDVNKFYSQTIDGTSVKDILKQCPSQQSYGIAKELNLPDGTKVPCKEFTNHDYPAIKYKSSSSGAAGAAGGSAGTDEPVGPPADGGSTPPADGGSTPPADSSSPVAGTGDWWSFFGSKEFLIGAVVLGGILAAIKALGNTIKARFRKCAKVIYNMQKDFGTKENGMDMKAVLPGVGSKITDWITRLWGSKTGKGKNKGALGLRPFVDNYRYEIEGDLAESKKAFNLIRGAADSQTSGAMNNLEKPKQPNESLDESPKVYESFAEALTDGQLNESEAINELALGTAIAAGSLALSAIKLAAGAFKFKSKDKEGNDVEKEVKVTPKSVREICYSILNVFYGKYFDLERAFKALGINDLGDVDKSNVDKFAKVVKKSSEEIPSGGKSKMFARVEKNYNAMVESYIKIGNTVVDNFEKFTKQKKTKDGKELSEKDSNLLVTATEKLKAELRRQEDGYKNNFARVMNAIISSKEYVEFTDFIINKVIPVFKTGLASDADYVLDVVPKVNDYYILRQTNDQAGLDANDTAKGNVVLARVKKFDQSGDKAKNPEITFARVAILRDPGSLKRTDKMEYDLTGYDEKNLDRTAFGKDRSSNADVSGQSGDSITLPYNKWLALDPTVALNVPGDDRDSDDLSTTKLYKRTIGEIDEYAFGISTKVKEGDAVESFDEAQNISEADGKVEITGEPKSGEESETKELETEDPQSDIVKLAVITVNKDADIFGDAKQIHLTCSYINLGTRCSAKQVDEKLKSLQFVALDNKTKEKEHIINSIANNIGYTHVSKIDAKDITSIDDSLKQLETRQTTSEKLVANLDKLADNLYQEMSSLNLKPEQLTTEISLGGAVNKSKFITLPKPNTKEPYYKRFPTGISDLLGNDIEFNYYPALINVDGSPVVSQNSSLQEADSSVVAGAGNAQSQAQPQTNAPTASAGAGNAQSQAQPQRNIPEGVMVGVVIAARNIISNQVKDPNKLNKVPAFHIAKLDKDSIKAALNALINDLVSIGNIEPTRNTNLGGDNTQQNTPTPESFSVEYDKYFNVAESFMSSFGFNGSNKLHVNRTIKAPKSKLTYYVLSENAWGDGSKKDPEAYIKETLDRILDSSKTYDDFASVAKSSHTTNLIKLSEDCSYNTAFPYNRYQMLTIFNPLYEGTVIVRFDNEGNLVESIRLGVKKIYCETV